MKAREEKETRRSQRSALQSKKALAKKNRIKSKGTQVGGGDRQKSLRRDEKKKRLKERRESEA